MFKDIFKMALIALLVAAPIDSFATANKDTKTESTNQTKKDSATKKSEKLRDKLRISK